MIPLVVCLQSPAIEPVCMIGTSGMHQHSVVHINLQRSLHMSLQNMLPMVAQLTHTMAADTDFDHHMLLYNRIGSLQCILCCFCSLECSIQR